MIPWNTRSRQAGWRYTVPIQAWSCLLALALTAHGQSTRPAQETNRASRLIAALKDRKAEVRGDAALQLGELKNPAAVVPLIGALKDPDRSVRSFAAASLGKIQDARAIGPLIAALKDPDGSTRR